jgi:hypothetical protein
MRVSAPALAAALDRSAAALPSEGRPREQGEAKARRARLRARLAADTTTQHVRHDLAEAAQ